MEPFLKETARRLLAAHPNDLHKVMVVFNNHRSGAFMRHHFEEISKAEGRPFFMPRILSISELVSELSNLKIVPNEFLLFELFDIHKSIAGEDRKYQTFEEFISFGDMMLSDFSSVDLYRVDAEQLFQNLFDLKQIGEWNVENASGNEIESNYLKFYKSIYQHYTILRERLLERHEAYEGMANRYVADHIDELADRIKSSQVYFVGFDALSACESAIIKTLKNRGIGHMITDGDPYYFDDREQEAGFFLRKHRANGDSDETEGYPVHFDKEKKITIVSCPENVLQAKYAGLLLDGFKTKKMVEDKKTKMLQEKVVVEDTAVVLADEKLLPAMLNSLPDEAEANVTMGIRFTYSAMHALMEKLFSLYDRSSSGQFYHTDILEVLSDSLIGDLLNASGVRASVKAWQLEKKLIRMSAENVSAMMSELRLEYGPVAFLFENADLDPNGFLDMAKKLTETLSHSLIGHEDRRELEAAGCLKEILDYFAELQQRYTYIDSLAILRKLYERLASRRTLSYIGEAMSGLQILGVLETRNLDFERVVMLSVNEGMLPAGRSKGNSLIPLSLKRHAGMPTYTEEDAVYAYHFFRFLQRAKEVYLFYCTASEEMGKGEKSRFVMQLQQELAAVYPEIKVEEVILTADTSDKSEEFMDQVEKTDKVMERLKRMAEYGFAPTSMSVYLDCPLRFYYEKVLKLKDDEDLEDSLDAAGFGTCVHEVLKHIYDPERGNEITVSRLEAAKPKVPELLKAQFESTLKNGEIEQGLNRYYRQVGEKQILAQLERDIRRLNEGKKLHIVQVEQVMKQSISSGVNIIGTADRIDHEDDDPVRVLDYKTGSVDDKHLKMNGVNGLERNDYGKIPGKWFQLAVYAWLYYKETGTTRLKSAIVPLRYANRELAFAQTENSEIFDKETLKAIESLLQNITSEIMDPDVPFKPSEADPKCDYCPMKEFCRLGITKKSFNN